MLVFFTHYSLLELFPKWSFGKRSTEIVYVILVSILIITLWYHYEQWYTFINFSYALIVLGLLFNYQRAAFQRFLPSYLIIFIPFFIINGILTGTGIEDQVVWYNNDQNLGIRLLTIPIEDTIYNLGMLLSVYGVMEFLESKK